MNPSNLGKQNGALVLEVLQVLGRPATIEEVSQRVANIYKVARKRIQPVVGDILTAGVHQGFFSCRNYEYSIIQPTIDQLRQDIDKYVDEMLSLDCTDEKLLPQPSPLMIKLEQLDGSPPLTPSFVLSPSPSSGELRERTPPGDASSAVATY
ncbi:uncharacterized protein LOC6575229 [Drosophila mojavensis]|uniref:DUF4777 domain-containing protein n=2 Tax=mojavensis species complex TaxID=198037 RepID=B4KA29_DROMO|nr:uncharacterized protein LOC6575229 [Drosophila mojavensis]XP_017865290.1 PREDICTED: uncharacterized protein LOC108615359 [Drosophila arizonae]XP_017966841.1 uncharacterized protein LOC108658699 [Drosophila navojoa]EDW16704.1 uncharacterized protein Dmoj_GI22081 [Drosophila mojavensis]